MDEETKRRIDVLIELWKGAWSNFHARRMYEWRYNFALWTALVAFVGIVLTGRLETEATALRWGVVIAGFLVLGIHVLWFKGISGSNKVDRDIALHYERIIQNLTESAFSGDLKQSVERVRETWGMTHRQWAFIPTLGITLTLVVACIASVWLGKS